MIKNLKRKERSYYKTYHTQSYYKTLECFEYMENEKSLLGETSIFKTLTFSKIIHLSLVTSPPSSTVALLNKIQKNFLWDKKNVKIKQNVTLRLR